MLTLMHLLAFQSEYWAFGVTWENLCVMLVCFFALVAGLFSYYGGQSKEQHSNGRRDVLSKRRMSNLGRSTLVTEIESNLSIATLITLLDGPINVDQWIKQLHEKMQNNPMFQRFRSQVINDEFVEMMDFDPKHHVHRVKLQDGETPYDYAENITNTPLSMYKPLWECAVVEDYDDKAFFIWRIHHCIGDGMALVTAFVHMSDESKKIKEMLEKSKTKSKAEKPKKEKKSTTLISLLVSYFQLVLLLVWSWWVITRKLLSLVLREEPKTILKKKGGKKKQLRSTISLSVTEAKKIGKKYGATLNDVMLAAITGGLRKTVMKHHPTLLHTNTTLRAAIPIDMRSSKETISYTNNRFSSLLVDLPVGLENPNERLHNVNKAMIEAKSSLEKYFLYIGSCVIGGLPGWFLKPALRMMTRQISVAISNIRGAPVALKYAGRNAIDLKGFVPPPPLVNVGIAIFSMEDSLGFTLSMDSNIDESPDDLMKNIMEEYEKLRELIKDN